MGGPQKPSNVSQGDFLFVVNGEASELAANLIPTPVDREQTPGKKRPHLKSRRGCLVCKRRRVKCDEQFPCSNCVKRHERCVRSKAAEGRGNELSPCISRPLHPLAVDNTAINLLHLELFSHFQSDLVDSLGFSEIWKNVLPWSFQEPYIMCAILCLAATHLSSLRPQVPRYSDVAVQLLGKSASLFSEKLSCAVTTRENGEELIAVAILMQYISWTNTEFIEKPEQLLSQNDNSALTTCLSKDPLLQLSFGVRGILYEAFRILSGSDSVFLAAGLYTPRHAIEEAISQQGEDPWKFVSYFMDIYNNPRYQPPVHDDGDDLPSHKGRPPSCPYTNRYNNELALRVGQFSTDPQQAAFGAIARRLSLLFCLVAMSNSNTQSASQVLTRLQPEIHRLFFSFPIHYSEIFREAALRGESRALIMLCHFYRAARILLISRGNFWWAKQRSRVIESVILQELTTRGLETCILDEQTLEFFSNRDASCEEGNRIVL
ncbi:hypothetical protein F5Y10DRAFT_57608 [Nemania abortiva]|nr:hypothetical protein F5Y10DRAFT_57608 [Nemania abortiva]